MNKYRHELRRLSFIKHLSRDYLLIYSYSYKSTNEDTLSSTSSELNRRRSRERLLLVRMKAPRYPEIIGIKQRNSMTLGILDLS